MRGAPDGQRAKSPTNAGRSRSKTTAEARQLALGWSGDIFRNFYGPLFPDWADRKKTAFGAPLLEAMDQTGLFQMGTVSEIRDEYVSQWKQLPAEYIVLIYHYAQAPKEAVLDQLQTFMREVKPALDELTPYAPDEK